MKNDIKERIIQGARSALVVTIISHIIFDIMSKIKDNKKTQKL